MSQSLVIIPTFNEKDNIEAIINSVFSLEIPFHIVVIDDNSPDGTGEIVKSLQQTYSGKLHLVEREGKSGLGTAYIRGFRYALDHGYDYIFEMDADFSHNPNDLVRLYETCHQQGYDVVIGSRYITGVNVVNWPIGRVLMSYFASSYVRLITGMSIRDATAGFICYRSRVLEKMDLTKIRFIGYAFQIEMKFTAWKMGFKIKEIPIIFTDRTHGESKMSKNILAEAIFGVIKMKLSSLFRKYDQINQSELP